MLRLYLSTNKKTALLELAGINGVRIIQYRVLLRSGQQHANGSVWSVPRKELECRMHKGSVPSILRYNGKQKSRDHHYRRPRCSRKGFKVTQKRTGGVHIYPIAGSVPQAASPQASNDQEQHNKREARIITKAVFDSNERDQSNHLQTTSLATQSLCRRQEHC